MFEFWSYERYIISKTNSAFLNFLFRPRTEHLGWNFKISFLIYLSTFIQCYVNPSKCNTRKSLTSRAINRQKWQLVSKWKIVLPEEHENRPSLWPFERKIAEITCFRSSGRSFDLFHENNNKKKTCYSSFEVLYMGSSKQ